MDAPIIKVLGQEAKLTPQGWTCQDETVSNLLKADFLLNLPSVGYSPNPPNTIAEQTAKRFKGEVIKLLPAGNEGELEEVVRTKGGKGSGNWGHSGRPGKVGGSAPSKGLAGIPSAIGPYKTDINPDILNSGPLTKDAQGRSLYDERMAKIKSISDANAPLFEFLGSEAEKMGITLKDQREFWSNEYYSYLGDAQAPLHFASDEDRGKIKIAIIKELSRRSGLNPATCNAFLEMWSDTSNKSDGAISFQEAIAEEFGSARSDYQKDQPGEGNKAEAKRLMKSYVEILQANLTNERQFASSVIRNITDKVTRGELVSSYIRDNKEYWAELHEQAGRTDKDIKELSQTLALAKLKGRLPIADRASERKFARTMYDYTQERLAAAGIKELTLFRGIGRMNPLKVGESAAYQGNSAESWSAGVNVAFNFSYGGPYKYVIAAKVPVKNILATAVTGLGCFTEYEYVVMPGRGAVVHVAYQNTAAG